MTLKLTLVFGSILFLSSSFGDETKTDQPAIENVKAPFANYWDAESWEKGSTDNFWNATSDSSREISPKRSFATEKDSKVWQRSK